MLSLSSSSSSFSCESHYFGHGVGNNVPAIFFFLLALFLLSFLFVFEAWCVVGEGTDPTLRCVARGSAGIDEGAPGKDFRHF